MKFTDIFIRKPVLATICTPASARSFRPSSFVGHWPVQWLVVCVKKELRGSHGTMVMAMRADFAPADSTQSSWSPGGRSAGSGKAALAGLQHDA